MTTTPSSGKIGYSDINNSFNDGTDIKNYHNVTWYYPANLGYGSFSSTTLKSSDFYTKQPNDPATPGSITLTTAGSGTFTIPLYRHTLKIELWGAGGGGAVGTHGNEGGSYQSGWTGSSGGSTSILGITASGGGGATGGYRYGTQNGPGGTYGTASGTIANATVLTKTNGNAGGTGSASNPPSGGTGGAAPNGGAAGNGGSQAPGAPGGVPGGGGGGGSYSDGQSKNPNQAAGGGGGGGAYANIYYASYGAITAGTVVPYTIGAGGAPGVDTNSNGAKNGNVGGVGGIRITWT